MLTLVHLVDQEGRSRLHTYERTEHHHSTFGKLLRPVREPTRIFQ